MMAQAEPLALTHGQPHWLRPLSSVEAGFALLHSRHQGTTQVMSWVTLRESLSGDALRRAASALFERYQLLRCCISWRDETLWFVEHGEFQRIGLEEVAQLDSADGFDAALRHAFTTPLDNRYALWRLHLLQFSQGGCAIVLVRDHAISDGFTTQRLFQQLLELLAQPLSATPLPEALPVWPEPQLTVELDTLPSSPLPPFDFRRWLPVAQRTPRFLDLDISREESQRIIAWCRRQGVSVTQLLSALFTKSFCRVTRRERCNLYTAVSLRTARFYPVPPQALGCHISVVLTTPPAELNDLAALAHACGAQLQQALVRWQPESPSHQQLSQRIHRLGEARSASGIALTNVGNIPAAAFDGGLMPQTMRTVVNRGAGNYAVVLHVMSLDGQLSGIFSWADPVMTPQDIVLMKDYFHGLMAQLTF